MDKLAHLVGMDPMEFRILNAYRDGDMKAHRREAKNTALIECVQVAAEKAQMAAAREFKRMSSRRTAAAHALRFAATAATALATGARQPHSSARPTIARRSRRRARSRRARHRRPRLRRRPRRSPPSHGAMRFSSVFGTRRR